MTPPLPPDTMPGEFIDDEADLLALLDSWLAVRESEWWDGFYEDRARPCPFFVDLPDGNLALWVEQGLLRAGKVLDLGCGNGRNAVFPARHGFVVEGVDYSRRALDWATERATAAAVAVQWHCRSVFDFEYEAGSYDLVYDAGSARFGENSLSTLLTRRAP